MSPPSLPSLPSLPTSTRSSKSSYPSISFRAVSMAFAYPKAKRSPSLTTTQETIECRSADMRSFLLQPKIRSGPLNGLFVDGQKPKKPKQEEEAKITAIQQRLGQKNITIFNNSDVLYAMNSNYAQGDRDKAYGLLSLLADSEGGLLWPYNPDVKLLGAVNREGVTCWFDSLMFAMFARLGSFEAMLDQEFEDEPRKRLVTLLRLWVNILRKGELITVDITKQIQLQLANCGWKDAAELRQHDASEAFTFITETLALPLLTLKMDIFHTGREDQNDDHKYINERLLELAIPEPTRGSQTVTLEDCLELYFNNKIEVKRYLDALERRNTLSSVRSRASVDISKAHSPHVEAAEVSDSQPSSQMPQCEPPTTSPKRPQMQRQRAPSIIQEHYIDEKQGLMLDGNSESRHARLRREVLMPAWQFFQLIPWYTDKQPVNDAQVAAHFSSTRPVLGICLKRYGMLPNGTAFKKRTQIDIPLEIGLPHFISDDDTSEGAPAFGNFKLSLQSFVCHEGYSVHSGHYISFARTPDPTQQGRDQWMRFDDLVIKERVTVISIEERLKGESPYLLFYQVMPIEETPSPLDGEEIIPAEAPPSYAESNASRLSEPHVSADSSTLISSSGDSVMPRASTDTSISDSERRGRSSFVIDRKNNGYNKGKNDSSAPSIEVARSESNVNASIAGPRAETDPASVATANIAASRRGSSISKTSNKSRPTSSPVENRFSAGFSRVTKRLSGDKLSSMPVVEGRSSVPTVASAIPAAETSSQKTKSNVRKEPREMSRSGPKEHHLVGKKDPDRECVMM